MSPQLSVRAGRWAIVRALTLLLAGCSSVTIPLGDRGSVAPDEEAMPMPMPMTMTMDHEHPGVDGAGHGSHGAKASMVVLKSRLPATAATRSAAAQFEARVIAAVRRKGWTGEAQVRRDGFVQMEFDTSHWYNPAHLTDGVQFDPARPEFLVLIDGRVIGEMFVPEGTRLTAPETPAAPFMEWHYHRYPVGEVCTSSISVQSHTLADGTCPGRDRPTTHSPLMAHVWIFGPEDAFAGMLPLGSTEP